MRECEHDNDRVSGRGSVNERPTERDESMWNTKGDRHCHLSHCTSVSLTLAIFPFLYLLAYLFSTCLFTLSFTFLKPSSLSHFLFFFFLCHLISKPHFLSSASFSLSPQKSRTVLDQLHFPFSLCFWP